MRDDEGTELPDLEAVFRPWQTWMPESAAFYLTVFWRWRSTALTGLAGRRQRGSRVIDNYTLYVMRHGETEDNVAKIITAQADSPLTERGRSQAADKGKLLQQVITSLDSCAFFSSPLHRACVTMELARAAAGVSARNYITDSRLMEMSFGTWTKWREGDDRYGPNLPSAHEQWNLQPPGGESQAMVFERVGQFLSRLRGDSVIVCHARVICMIRSHILRLSPQQTMTYKPPNAGLLRLSAGSESQIGV